MKEPHEGKLYNEQTLRCVCVCCVGVSERSVQTSLLKRMMLTQRAGPYRLVNFDHPAAFDWELLRSTLRALKRYQQVSVPHYNFKTHSREPNAGTLLYGADVLIVEGIMALYDAEVRAELDMRVFVDTDADVRLCRRLRRDIAERG